MSNQKTCPSSKKTFFSMADKKTANNGDRLHVFYCSMFGNPYLQLRLLTFFLTKRLNKSEQKNPKYFLKLAKVQVHVQCAIYLPQSYKTYKYFCKSTMISYYV